MAQQPPVAAGKGSAVLAHPLYQALQWLGDLQPPNDPAINSNLPAF
jgi:hypothetical protein